MGMHRPSSRGDADAAAGARGRTEPARAKALVALADGRWLPVSVLAAEAGVAGTTMAGILDRLVAENLVIAEPNGRHRVFRLADGPAAAQAAAVPAVTIGSMRPGTRACDERRARHCYTHLGGRLAVALTDAMARCGDLAWSPAHPLVGAETTPAHVLGPVDVTVTASGAALLHELDVPVAAGETARCCVDGTEYRHHLAGAPGRGILTAARDRGWITADPRSRALWVTPAGRRQLERLFTVDLQGLA